MLTVSILTILEPAQGWIRCRKETPVSQATIDQIERPLPPAVTLRAAAATKANSRKPQRGWILATLCLAQLMISLDVLIVNIALPSAQRSLGFGIADRQW